PAGQGRPRSAAPGGIRGARACSAPRCRRRLPYPCRPSSCPWRHCRSLPCAVARPDAADRRPDPARMPTIQRSALVDPSAARMFALVNDIAAYPRRFDWCEAAQVLESDGNRVVARLDLGFGALRTWFTTENTLSPPHHIQMALRAGPFKSLHGRWQFHALDESA